MIITGVAIHGERSVVTRDMKIFKTKKRMVMLSLAACTVVGLCAIEAGAIGSVLSLRGSATFCLSPDAARALADQKVTLEATGPATASGNCVKLPGKGTLKTDLTGGELPLEGGMRFTSADHRLDLSNLNIHIRLGEGYTSADVSQDGAPAANADFLRFPVSPGQVSFTPTSVDTRNNPVKLSPAGTAAFTNAFGATPVLAGAPLFVFDGHGAVTLG
ncbi:HtaA domain-containing protein [Streptomyces sp. NPDC085929]|uniref:HtaA domain-containing protein n=1 Tax=Streptomyces sp. NPDC085929 TaxID=3365739 RepID=UPI0037D1C457